MKTNTAFLAAVVWAAIIHAKNLGNLLFRKDSEINRASVLEDQVVSPAARALTAMAGTNSSSPYYDPTFDAFNTPSVKCRLEMERFQNDNIDHWLAKNKEFPLIEWIWELQDESTGETYYNGLFHVLLCGRGNCSPDRARRIASYDWTWQDQFGQSHKMDRIDLYDLEFEPRIHFRMVPPPASHNKDALVPKSLVAVKPGSGPFVYDLQPYLNCNRIEKAHPPPRQPKIGACIARFLGQHDLMPEWIAYHRLLGIEHFFVFVSEPFESVYRDMPRHETDITYLPYNFTWSAHKDNGGDETMVTAVSGFNAHGENWFQSYANNQCLYMAKQHGFDWVIAPDVDEYIVVNDPTIEHFGGKGLSPLQQFFQKHNSVVSEPEKCNGERKKKAIRKARQMKEQKVFRRRRLLEEEENNKNNDEGGNTHETEVEQTEQYDNIAREQAQEIEAQQIANENKVKGSRKQPSKLLLPKQSKLIKGTSRRRLGEQQQGNNNDKHDVPGETEAERRARKRERFRQWHREREEKQARKRAAAAAAAAAALNNEQNNNPTEEEEQEKRQKEQEEKEKWNQKVEDQELHRQQEQERNQLMQQRREQLSQEIAGENNDNNPKFDSVGNPVLIQEEKDSVDTNDIDAYDGPILQICLYGASYGKHPELEKDKRYQISLDFTHRIDKKIDGSGECRDDGHGAGGRRKCFYNAQLVEDIHVHGMKDDEPYFRGTSHASVEQIELFHFRSPLNGPRHTHNWKEEPVAVEDLVSYPRARDMYKERVLAELKRNNWPLPRFGKHRCDGYNC